MPIQEFIDELTSLGYKPERQGENRVIFDYVVQEGKFKDQTIKLGFDVPPDWNLNPPSGPHMSPRILPLNPGAPAHPERTAESPFGPEWEYWSRPFPNWTTTHRTVKDYLRYIKHLFRTQ